MAFIKVDIDYSEVTKAFEKMASIFDNFNYSQYGERGVNALRDATPVDTGKTASSWSYEVVKNNDGVEIQWNNSNVNDGVNIAVILEYGHGTRNGGYVRGKNYLGPALTPIFEQILEDLKKEVP